MFLAATVLVLTATLLLQPVVLVNAQAAPGDYIVTEWGPEVLSRVTPGGVRTVIYTFAGGTNPASVAIDSGGNYIVAERGTDVLSKVTPGGVRTVIYTFAGGTAPSGVAIDSAGNYIVTETGPEVLSKVTPSGVRTVIYTFAGGTGPYGVAIVPTPRPVGGVLTPVNKLTILAPYLALIGLVGSVTAAAVMKKRREA